MRIDWATEIGELAAIEATLPEVERHAAALATGYNHPRNAELMGHAEAISPAEVVESYREWISEGARAFLLFRDGKLVGDADLRRLRDGAGEFAFMIGAPADQGKGWGTRFATMVHLFGFATLELRRIYASIAAHNTASRRVFEKLGYIVDTSPTARGYAEEPDDVVMGLDRAAFDRSGGDAGHHIRISES